MSKINTLIAHCEGLKAQNKQLEVGLKGTELYVKKFKKDVKSIEAQLNPKAKRGHKKMFLEMLEEAQWNLEKYEVDQQNFQQKFDDNQIIIDALTDLINSMEE